MTILIDFIRIELCVIVVFLIYYNEKKKQNEIIENQKESLYLGWFNAPTIS